VTELLKRGRLASTELVEFRGSRAVRKTLRMTPRIPLFSRSFDRWLADREVRQLKAAEGIAGIPRVVARPAPDVYLREFVEGTPLPRAPTPPGEFFDELAAIARALHERGITHNDLHKEANVIVMPDGRPGLIDFQLSVSLPRGSTLHRLLAGFDLYHVAKNRRHRTGEPLTGEDARLFERTQTLRRLHRGLVKKPMNVLTRRLFPKKLGKLPTDTDP
jgi:predicted Ser/Thr protein kinase